MRSPSAVIADFGLSRAFPKLVREDGEPQVQSVREADSALFEPISDEAQLILPWALHLHTEEVRGGGKFSWARRSASRVLALATEYRNSRYVFVHNFSWTPVGWNWSFTDPKTADLWTVDELTSSVGLYEEGIAMSHCVGGYANYCYHGLSAIFSLRNNGSRSLTIEMKPEQKHCVQARGFANQSKTPEQNAALSRWIAFVRQQNAPTTSDGTCEDPVNSSESLDGEG